MDPFRLEPYYNDIGVEYRRMDHWNNAYGPVRRRPDGGLWYDYAALDNSIYNSTGGFSFKAYPTVDYSPACMSTELLRNPLQVQNGTSQGWMTPVGTMMYAGETIHPLIAKVLHSASTDRNSAARGIRCSPGEYNIRPYRD